MVGEVELSSYLARKAKPERKRQPFSRSSIAEPRMGLTQVDGQAIQLVRNHLSISQKTDQILFIAIQDSDILQRISPENKQIRNIPFPGTAQLPLHHEILGRVHRGGP
ncbi:hypothetical protein BDW66DRAFT_109093 [Aspergillus desertorum]